MKRLRHRLGAAVKLQGSPASRSLGAPDPATLRRRLQCPPQTGSPGPARRLPRTAPRADRGGQPGSEQHPGSGSMGGGGVPAAGRLSPCPPCRLGQRGSRRHPRPPTLPALGGRGESQLRQVGARGLAGTYLGGWPGSPRRSRRSSGGAVAGEALASLLRSCRRHTVWRFVSPQRSGSAALRSLGRGARWRRSPSARAEASGAPWRPHVAVPQDRQPPNPGLECGYPHP